MGIDFSERMITIARGWYPEIDFRVDDRAALRIIADEHFDLVIANYVLVDTPDLRDTMAAFHRVLKPGGVAVLVFSHPCFPRSGPSSRRTATRAAIPGAFRASRSEHASIRHGPISPRTSSDFIDRCRITGKPS
jgi:ubiquinone/menaquinone biosynthesis C-methylase UbiE